MADDKAPDPSPRSTPDPAQARLAALLRDALPATEEELADEIQRLMLHLSREPLDANPALPAALEDPERASLLRRLFGRAPRSPS
ncbi:hypothetical protein [Sphingomonas hengshuiensis]|uniref:Uncharacterized protein n=1 Tax=Sphingomonas hengshuiensis TaxID=1609977 RepID=A0A7U4LEK1_9SPHN|nr:hypothetical protein [Sphingomonas hengshuiensis]AJP71480.1 hypothetical protein TS85_06385 [Sphingomonas hengshuiensis]